MVASPDDGRVTDPYPQPGPVRMLLRGLVRHCPRCGSGHLFVNWLKMKPRCPRCGMCFEREEGFFLGAFTVNFGVMLLSLALFIGIGIALTLPDPPPGKLALGGMLVGVVVPTFFYPMSRTFWSAIDLIMKPLEPAEITSAAQAQTKEQSPPAP
jgi:uncharacterized protein (DUF983 family)